MKEYKKDQIVLITCGEYSDYSIGILGKCLVDINLEDCERNWIEYEKKIPHNIWEQDPKFWGEKAKRVSFGNSGFFNWLVNIEGLIVEIDHGMYHMSDDYFSFKVPDDEN